MHLYIKFYIRTFDEPLFCLSVVMWGDTAGGAVALLWFVSDSCALDRRDRAPVQLHQQMICCLLQLFDCNTSQRRALQSPTNCDGTWQSIETRVDSQRRLKHGAPGWVNLSEWCCFELKCLQVSKCATGHYINTIKYR